ncbi:hypothetical protein Taro_014541, partial [Colocasia esculenta]|nr:hypothetical protein [Colocasia esculenta]
WRESQLPPRATFPPNSLSPVLSPFPSPPSLLLPSRAAPAMSGRGSSKRRAPVPSPATQPSKRFQPSPGGNGHESPQVTQQRGAGVEDEMMDEDVFLEETLLKYEEDEEALLLLQHEALSARLAKWGRPPISQGYLSSSRSVIFQQLEIDYVIGESHKELLPNSSGPAAILRMFGVTREGLIYFLSRYCCLLAPFIFFWLPNDGTVGFDRAQRLLSRSRF